jgi:hypothetical protein
MAPVRTLEGTASSPHVVEQAVPAAIDEAVLARVSDYILGSDDEIPGSTAESGLTPDESGEEGQGNENRDQGAFHPNASVGKGYHV